MTDTQPMKVRAEAFYRQLQSEICSTLEETDGKAVFEKDEWTRPGGGGGLTRVIGDGAVLEKGAVNVSAVWGEAPPALVEHLKVDAKEFFATGISMIFHPRNPHAPTMHANVRYFETDTGVSWFGGGLDMTPYYVYEEDAEHFHRVTKECCERHPTVADYPAWKAWCDRYFFLQHRGEARGIGGIFFDHLKSEPEATFAFQQDLGRSLMPAYLPILKRRKSAPTTPEQELWQLRRRGRYVEFNLLFDRGTKFGLQTGGRTESILVSMPPRVRWDYGADPEPGTPEHKLLSLVSSPAREWT